MKSNFDATNVYESFPKTKTPYLPDHQSMMDNEPPRSGGGMFGIGGGQQSNYSQLSPYLNIDPSYLQAQTPEFIFDQVTKPFYFLK